MTRTPTYHAVAGTFCGCIWAFVFFYLHGAF